MKRLSIRKLLSQKYTFSVLGLVALCILSSILSGTFYQLDNILTILRQASILLILSSGLTVILLSGGVDLSVSNIAALSGCICAQALKAELPIPAAILAGLLTGMLFGLFNGFLVGHLRIAPFVATYGTSWMASGIAIFVMQGQVIYGVPQAFNWLGVGYVMGVPLLVIFSIVLVALFYILLERTTFGQNVYMLGANALAAKYSAMKVTRMTLATYAVCGLTAGIGGVLMTARFNAAEATMGDSFGLQTVAAVVMGGTSMLGGEGGILGTIVGALILTIIVNIMNLVGISSYWQGLAVGSVIILMVFNDIYNRSGRETRAIV